MVDEILRPLLQADGGEIELVSVSEQEVMIELGGASAHCAGRDMVQTNVIEPAIREAAGADVRVLVRKAPTHHPKRPSAPVSPSGDDDAETAS